MSLAATLDRQQATPSTPRTPAERRTHRALCVTEPRLAAGFLRHLARARRTVLRRLLVASWREDVAGLRRASSRSGGWVVHDLGPGAAVTFPVRAEGAFDRIEPAEPVLRLDPGTPGGVTAVRSPTELAGLLRTGEPAPGWDALIDEIDDGVANLALAYARDADRRGPTPGDEDVLLYYERRNTEGHNLHPCARTRLGMTVADVLRYDLESDEPAELVLVGVRRDRVESAPDAFGRDIGELLRARYPALDQAVRRQLPDPGGYVFLPVHPWQLDRAVRPLFAADIAEGAVVVVPAARLRATPTASLRTLLTAPSDTGERLFVKTAMDVQITSTRRTISAHTTNNGPGYSRLLRDIVAREPHLAGRVVPLSELAGASYRSADERRGRALSALVRDSPRLAAGEVAVPGCSLTAVSPHTGGSVVCDLLDARGGPATALDWLEEYTSLLLPAVVTLMTKYGVGLEAHLQNCVPTFSGGRPRRLLLRDWGGIRIYPPRLERHGIRVDARPGAPTVTDDVGVVRARALSTTLPNHLDEIVCHLAARAGVGEGDAWRRVRRVLDGVLAQLGDQPGLRADVAADSDVLLAPRLPVKALVRMRLWPEDGEQYRCVSNPLRD